MNAIEKIEAQQAELKDTDPAWMVGEQLKDICRTEPHCEKLVAEDLENPSMSLQKAAVKIKEYADKNRTGKCFCVTPKVADGILREFYGLPAATATAKVQPEKTKAPNTGHIKLASFLK